MKLGSETGSLINHVYSAAQQPEPTVGMGVTLCHWTDRSPGTVVNVERKGAKVRIVVQDDDYERTDNNGMSEMQTHHFSPNSENQIRFFERNGDGAWKQVIFNKETKRWNKVSGPGLSLGHRDAYYDFSF